MNDLLMKDLIKELRANRTNSREIADCERAARDRVDISLEKYEQMRDEIEDLRAERDKYKNTIKADNAIFKKIGIPYDIRDKICSLNVEEYKDGLSRKTRVNITFEYDEELGGRLSMTNNDVMGDETNP